MTDRVSTMDLRRRIGSLLDRVAFRHDEFIIERKGKAVAALVSIERLEQCRRFARRHEIEFIEQQQPSALSASQAAALASEAKSWARRSALKSRPKTK